MSLCLPAWRLKFFGFAGQREILEKSHRYDPRVKVWHQIFGVCDIKPCKIYPRMCDVSGEVRLNQKLFTDGINMGLPMLAWVKKTVYVVFKHRLSVKEKFPVIAFSKELYADSFPLYESSIPIDFLEKKPCILLLISKVKLVTVVEGDQKAPFSIATTPRCRGRRLPLCRGAVGVFYSPSRLGKLRFHVKYTILRLEYMHTFIHKCIHTHIHT